MLFLIDESQSSGTQTSIRSTVRPPLLLITVDLRMQPRRDTLTVFVLILGLLIGLPRQIGALTSLISPHKLPYELDPSLEVQPSIRKQFPNSQHLPHLLTNLRPASINAIVTDITVCYPGEMALFQRLVGSGRLLALFLV